MDTDLNQPAAAMQSRGDAPKAVAGWLARLGSKPHPFVQAMPDVSLLRVTNGEQELVYTLIRNKAHANVSFMFNESERRIPEDDTISIAHVFVGSYPNHIFEIDASQISEFVGLLLGWTGSEEQRTRLFRGFGASRYEPDFWQAYDRISRSFERRDPTVSGVLDLGKYGYE